MIILRRCLGLLLIDLVVIASEARRSMCKELHYHSLCSPDEMKWNPGFLDISRITLRFIRATTVNSVIARYEVIYDCHFD